MNSVDSHDWPFTELGRAHTLRVDEHRGNDASHDVERGRLMTTLFAAQVCGSTGHSIGMAIGGIMAAGITARNTWSGIPIAVGALGTALASWPLSRLMERWGRRPGLALATGSPFSARSSVWSASRSGASRCCSPEWRCSESHRPRTC